MLIGLVAGGGGEGEEESHSKVGTLLGPTITTIFITWICLSVTAVRLSSYPKGRIEFLHEGEWGTQCGHFW